MIRSIIDGSLKERVLVLLAAIIIAMTGIWSFKNMPLDAIPDLSDVQVIVFTKYPGQAPQVVEDQVTYPLTTAMLSVPKAKVVRGYSFFGLSVMVKFFSKTVPICIGPDSGCWNISITSVTVCRKGLALL
jgi:Cu(I)/Ag(I) efflux system membrane protein CusA/SilA